MTTRQQERPGRARQLGTAPHSPRRPRHLTIHGCDSLSSISFIHSSTPERPTHFHTATTLVWPSPFPCAVARQEEATLASRDVCSFSTRLEPSPATMSRIPVYNFDPPAPRGARRIWYDDDFLGRGEMAASSATAAGAVPVKSPIHRSSINRLNAVPLADPASDVTISLNPSSGLYLPRVIDMNAGDIVDVGRSSKSEYKNLQAASDNALFDCPVISRRHAELKAAEKHGQGYVVSIADLASLHGTTVNGQRLLSGQEFVLKSGDVVKLGDRVTRADGTCTESQPSPHAWTQLTDPSLADTHDGISLTVTYASDINARGHANRGLEHSLFDDHAMSGRRFEVPSESEAEAENSAYGSDIESECGSSNEPSSAKTTPEQAKAVPGSQQTPIDLDETNIVDLSVDVDDEDEPYLTAPLHNSQPPSRRECASDEGVYLVAETLHDQSATRQPSQIFDHGSVLNEVTDSNDSVHAECSSEAEDNKMSRLSAGVNPASATKEVSDHLHIRLMHRLTPASVQIEESPPPTNQSGGKVGSTDEALGRLLSQARSHSDSMHSSQPLAEHEPHCNVSNLRSDGRWDAQAYPTAFPVGGQEPFADHQPLHAATLSAHSYQELPFPSPAPIDSAALPQFVVAANAGEFTVPSQTSSLLGKHPTSENKFSINGAAQDAGDDTNPPVSLRKLVGGTKRAASDMNDAVEPAEHSTKKTKTNAGGCVSAQVRPQRRAHKKRNVSRRSSAVGMLASGAALGMMFTVGFLCSPPAQWLIDALN